MDNLAARAGRRSAARWKTVTACWLVFAVVAVVLGGTAGTKKLKDADTASGGTRTAEQILQRAHFKHVATEAVLVQSRSASIAEAPFRAVVREVVATVGKSLQVKAVRSPLDPAAKGLVAKGGHAALVEFDLRGDATKAQDRVQPFLDEVAAIQARHTDFTVGEFGEASANHVLSKTLGNDFRHAEYSSLPVTLVILLGLSMDYHVFIISRVKELVDAGVPTDEAVARGIRRTASTVTSAAIVMVAVFAIFVTLHTLDIKQMGFGLAAAILIDSTIVRAVLLPAAMKLLGEWSWYLPSWLEWLPRIGLHEESPEGPVPVD